MPGSPYMFAPGLDSIDREGMKQLIIERRIECGVKITLPDGREGTVAAITEHFSVIVRPYRGGFWPGALTRIN